MLVDDNLITQSVLTDFLHSQVYQVALASNGVDAIQRALELRPALILMDIQMPGMNGLEAIRHLRAIPQLSATPIIALTSLAMPGDRERCLAAGASEYLVKPMNLARLAHTAEALLQPKPGQLVPPASGEALQPNVRP